MNLEDKIFYTSIWLAIWIILYYLSSLILSVLKKKDTTLESKVVKESNLVTKTKNSDMLSKAEKWPKNKRKMPIMQNKEKDRIISYWCKWLAGWIFIVYLWLVSLYIKNFLDSKWLNFIGVIFDWKLIFIVIGFSIIWWVANIFHNIYMWIKNANNFNIILEHESLFRNKEQFNLLLTQSLLGRYDKNWNMWIEVQPILSTLVWVIVYFILKSWIQLSGNVPSWEPSVFFYWWIAFLCGFFYEKFLDFLQKISNQIINTDWFNESVITKLSEFETLKKSIIKDTQIKTNKMKR